MFVCKIFYIVLTTIGIIPCIKSAKVLGIFPFPSESHQILGSALLKELAVRGHEVTMISPFPLKAPFQNYTDVYLDGVADIHKEKMRVIMDPNISYFEKMFIVTKSINSIGEAALESNGFKTFMELNKQFDVVIQFWAMTEAFLGVGYRLNASTIAFSPIGPTVFLNHVTANPNPYSYIPQFLPFSNEMTFLQRVLNTITNIGLDIALNFVVIPSQKKLLKLHFPDAPSLDELLNNVDLALTNSHISTETPRPYLPNVIQIGGFHIHANAEMPIELKTYLDNAKHGVILFSLGSNVKSEDLPKSTIDAIIKTFSKLKFDVLWKFESDLSNKPKNVRVSTWLPQRAVLAHPNVIAFITHGGFGSTVEAIYHGVPMICIPFFGDQSKNVKDSVTNGYAIHLDANDINENTLMNSIIEITENPVYALRYYIICNS